MFVPFGAHVRSFWAYVLSFGVLWGALGGHPLDVFGIIWKSCWAHLGVIGSHVGNMFEVFWVILLLFWDLFLIMRGLFCRKRSLTDFFDKINDFRMIFESCAQRAHLNPCAQGGVYWRSALERAGRKSYNKNIKIIWRTRLTRWCVPEALFH